MNDDDMAPACGVLDRLANARRFYCIVHAGREPVRMLVHPVAYDHLRRWSEETRATALAWQRDGRLHLWGIPVDPDHYVPEGAVHVCEEFT